MSNLLSKDEILSQVLKTQIIDVPMVKEGAQVKIMELPSGRRDYFEASMIVDAQQGKSKTVKVETKQGVQEVPVERFRARIVAMSLVDENDKWMFEPGDEDKLAELGCEFINTVADEVVVLNNMSDADIDQIKKDSEQIQDTGSNSDLQDT
jgi:hypothetical protein